MKASNHRTERELSKELLCCWVAYQSQTLHVRFRQGRPVIAKIVDSGCNGTRDTSCALHRRISLATLFASCGVVNQESMHVYASRASQAPSHVIRTASHMVTLKVTKCPHQRIPDWCNEHCLKARLRILMQRFRWQQQSTFPTVLLYFELPHACRFLNFVPSGRVEYSLHRIMIL